MLEDFTMPTNGSMIGLVNYAQEPGSVELRELPVPEIGEDDVLLNVHSVGI